MGDAAKVTDVPSGHQGDCRGVAASCPSRRCCRSLEARNCSILINGSELGSAEGTVSTFSPEERTLRCV